MRRGVVTTQAFYVRVGESVRRARVEQRISSIALADWIGVTPRQLQRMETAEVPIRLHVLTAIADELDLSLDELVSVEIDNREQVA